MPMQTIVDLAPKAPAGWLKSYYFARFAVAGAWVVLAVTVAARMPHLAAAMLIAYPAWDAIANVADARRNGGFAVNGSQTLNAVVSTLTALAVGLALVRGAHAVLAVFGVWAIVAGLFQLATGLRRWRVYGAQWAMILSGAQSAFLAGVHFVIKAGRDQPAGITDIAPYAAFGAFYFLVSALWLAIGDARRGRVAPAA